MDKKTVLAFLLIGAILILTQSNWYKETILGIKPQPTKNQTSTVQPDESYADAEDYPETTEPPKEPVVKPDSTRASGYNITMNQSNLGEDITIETDLYKGILSTKGGIVKSWKLKKYLHGKDKQSLVELIKKEGYGNLGIQFPVSEDTIRTYDFVFNADIIPLTISSIYVKSLFILP